MTALGRPLSAALLLALAAGSATAQLRVATWNISHFDGTDRLADVQTAVYGSFSGRQFAPDVILLQEMMSASAVNTLVTALNTAPGSPGDWAAAPYVDGADIDNSCVYRTGKLSLVGNKTWTVAIGSSDPANQPRNTYRYDLRPVGYSNDQAVISMYSIHLKSGSATSDQARRLVETTRIVDNVNGISTGETGSGKPAAYKFLVGGDTNVQSATQSAYVEMVGDQVAAPGPFFDPIHSGRYGSASNNGGNWNNNGNYQYIHTQDPTGAGGMDDRHDQILIGANLVDGGGMDYIGNATLTFSQTTWNDPNHSYRCWGNDGTSFNLALTTTGNAMVGPTIAQALKNCATTAGGHLPVYLDLRMPARIAAPATINFGTVTQNTTAQQSVQIGNGGDTALWTVNGIANLSYTLAASTGFTAPSGTFTDAPDATLNSHNISMNTATLGVKTGTIVVTSTVPDVPPYTMNVTGTVVAANLPPTANAGPDQNVTDSDGNGTQPITLDGSMSTDSDGNIILYRWTEGANVLASSTLATSNVVLPVGVHTIQLTVTDNNNATASDTVVVTVNPRPNQPPTANAGADQAVTDTDGSGSEPVSLDGSLSSDPDGSITNYTWMEGATTLSTGSTAPANVSLAIGAHTLTLIVTDNNNATATDTVVVTVNPRPNQPPTANAGADQAVTDIDGSGSEPVTLDGSLSSDPDGSITNYTWKEGDTTLSTGSTATANVSLAVGAHTLTLIVTDNNNATATDTVLVTVNPRPNQPPTANAGADQDVIDADGTGDEPVTLDGSLSSDPDGSITSYSWAMPGVGEIATGVMPTIVLPVGTSTITLTVTDNQGAHAADTVVVNVSPRCIADYNNDGGIDGADVESFFTDWESGLNNADVNLDGGVDGADVETFFERWESGSC